MVEKTVTIAIDANIKKFKEGLSKARSEVRQTTKKIGEDAKKASDEMEKASKGGGFKSLVESVKGVSPALDNVLGTVSDMRDRLKGAGKAGKLAMMGIKVAVGGLALGLVSVLGKALMTVTGKLAKLSDPVRFDKNMSEMKESTRKLKTALGELASPVFEWMSKGVKALADGLTWVVEKIAQFVGFLQGLLGIGHKVNQTLKGTADAMQEAGASADAGLASFDKLTTLNVDEMGNMDQAEKIAGLMADMRKRGEESAKAIAETFKPIRELLDMDVGEIWVRFKDSAVNAWDGIKSWAQSSWEGIKASISGTWSSMVGWASGAWDSIASKSHEVWQNVSATAHNVWTSIKEYILGKFHAVGDAMKGIFTGVVNAFRSAWDKAFGAIQSAIKWILDKISWVMDKINGMKNAVSNAYQGAKDWVSDKVGGVKKALGFAQGGLFQPNQPQLALLGDNKVEPEVVAPRSMIMDAMREVMVEMGGSATPKGQDITLAIDGKVLARYTYDDMVAEGTRRGRSTIA